MTDKLEHDVMALTTAQAIILATIEAILNRLEIVEREVQNLSKEMNR